MKRGQGTANPSSMVKALSLRSITVEAGLYGLVALVAAALRLYALGTRPLQPEEASQALAAWSLLHGKAPGAGYSPLLFLANLLLFFLAGASDFVARLPSALLGIALVLTPFLFRRRLGRWGALSASATLALSPTALFFSRHLSGDTAVAVCALTLTAALLAWADSKDERGLYVGAVALALMLTAGPGAYTALVAFASFALVSRLRWREPLAREWDAWRESVKEGGKARSLGVLMGSVFLLSSTALLLNPSGLGAAADLFSAWMERLRQGPGMRPLALLLLYEPFVLLFGLLGCRDGLRRREPFPLFLGWWAGVAAFLCLVTGRHSAGDVLLVISPLALLGGAFLGRVIEEAVREATWQHEGTFLAIALILCVYLGLGLANYAFSGRPVFLLAAGVALALLVAFAGLWGIKRGETRRGVTLTAALVLLALSVNLGWNLNFARAGSPYELLPSSPTSPQVLDLRRTLERLSAQTTGDSHAMEVVVEEATGPVVAWYVRDFPNARWVDTVSRPSALAVITREPGEEPSLKGDYVGRGFVLRSTWAPPSPWEGLHGVYLMRWLLYREALPSPTLLVEKVVLWTPKAGGAEAHQATTPAGLP